MEKLSRPLKGFLGFVGAGGSEHVTGSRWWKNFVGPQKFSALLWDQAVTGSGAVEKLSRPLKFSSLLWGM